MNSLLHFICPTDCLETIINGAFRQENYYYSSLGNSVTFNKKVLKETRKLIQEKNIREISFVLSSDNRIVMDAYGNQSFSNIRGLNKFYTKVIEQKEQVETLWQTWNPNSLMLSYYLNDKIKELRAGLNDLADDQFKISGKIYDQQQNIFKEIYPDLICMDYPSFN